MSYGSEGAIEIKAAWVELKDSSLYPKYKIAQAIVQGPNDPQPRPAVVGLVGLHIIHKVSNAQQFTWATFEHIDNAPNRNEAASANKSYLYFNAQCNPQTDHYQCKWNAEPQTPCKVGQTSGCDPYTAAIQVVRLNAIPNSSSSLNSAVWTTLQALNSDSVYLNYQLIDVLWPNSSTNIPPNATTPLNTGNPQSGTPSNFVANTTMETYFQKTFNCLDCHKLAPIASPALQGKKARVFLTTSNAKPPLKATSNPLASDYSFLFQAAQTQSKSRLRERK